MVSVTVDHEKCTGCEECVDNCSQEVFEMQDEKSVPVNGEECLDCTSCLEVCEADAITVIGEDGEELEKELIWMAGVHGCEMFWFNFFSENSPLMRIQYKIGLHLEKKGDIYTATKVLDTTS